MPHRVCPDCGTTGAGSHQGTAVDLARQFSFLAKKAGSHQGTAVGPRGAAVRSCSRSARETLRLTLGLGIQSGDLLEESQQDMSIPEPSLSGEEDQAPSDWSSMVLVLSAVVLVNSAFGSRHSLNSHKTCDIR